MMSWAYLLPILTNWSALARYPELLAVKLAILLLVTLVMLVVLMVLAVYDAKWGNYQ